MEQDAGKHEQALPFLERLSEPLQDAIKVVIGSHRKPPRRLKSLLNGTWLGPPASSIPLARWDRGKCVTVLCEW